MRSRKISPRHIADQIRRLLKDGGSTEHSAGVQWFFKEEIKSHGWYTAALRKAAVQFRRRIASEHGMDFVVQVANQLFSGRNLEEKVFAVFLLENQTMNFGDKEFRLFTSWLDRVSSWADHDALVHDVLAPMIAATPSRSHEVFQWAKSPNRWRRRAACVALIRGTREKKFFSQIVRLSNQLLRNHEEDNKKDEDDKNKNDKEDMVLKGLGWLLRETAKANPARTVPYLMKIRKNAPRLVLRTACETLSAAQRWQVLK